MQYARKCPGIHAHKRSVALISAAQDERRSVRAIRALHGNWARVSGKQRWLTPKVRFRPKHWLPRGQLVMPVVSIITIITKITMMRTAFALLCRVMAYF